MDLVFLSKDALQVRVENSHFMLYIDVQAIDMRTVCGWSANPRTVRRLVRELPVLTEKRLLLIANNSQIILFCTKSANTADLKKDNRILGEFCKDYAYTSQMIRRIIFEHSAQKGFSAS